MFESLLCSGRRAVQFSQDFRVSCCPDGTGVLGGSPDKLSNHIVWEQSAFRSVKP